MKVNNVLSQIYCPLANYVEVPPVRAIEKRNNYLLFGDPVREQIVGATLCIYQRGKKEKGKH